MKEFLQNADDAKATRLLVTFDRRTHRGTDVSELAGLMGPALLFENDRVFTDEDLKAIRSIGAGSKREDVARTGQFGRGFNTAYTVTDYPSFVTRDRLRCFDPFDDVVSKKSGDHGTEWTLDVMWRACPTWLRSFGLPPGTSSLDRTVFRLPLRTADQASADRLVNRAFAFDEVTDMLAEVQAFGPALLLFLRHVRHLKIREIDADGSERTCVSLRTENEHDVESARSRLRLSPDIEIEQYLEAWRRDPETAPRTVYHHTLTVARDEGQTRREEWLVCQSLEPGPKGELLEPAFEVLSIGQKAVPQAGIACKINAQGSPERVDGHLFCTLPLPISSGLPFHVNGFFDLDSSRRGLTLEEGAHSVRVRTAWNKALMGWAVPACAGRLFHELLSEAESLDPVAFYNVWPTPPADAQVLGADLVDGIYRQLASQTSMRVRGDESARWVLPHEARRPGQDWTNSFVEAVRADGLELVEPAVPKHVLDGLDQLGHAPKRVQRAQVLALLRRAGPYRGRCGDAPLHCLRDRSHILRLVRLFARAPATELEGLPLSLRSDGSLRVLGSEVGVLAADAEVRQLVQEYRGSFLEPEVVDCFPPGYKIPGLRRIEPTDFSVVLRSMHRKYEMASPGSWGTTDGEALDYPWLEEVISFLARHPPREAHSALQDLPLIPDQEGVLHPLYVDDSACRPRHALTPKQEAVLETLGVPIASGPDTFLAALEYLTTKLEGTPLCTLAEAIARRLLGSPADALSSTGRETLLDLLALAHEEDPLDSETLENLAQACIWPTRSGLRAAKAPSVYLPADFQPPGFGGDVHLLQLGTDRVRKDLFEAMGVEPYRLDQFLREVFLRRFAKFDDQKRQAAVTWLADPGRLSHLKTASALCCELREASIAPTTVGDWVAPSQVYHPKEVEAHALLEDRAPILKCLDPAQEEGWIALFGMLRMARQPRPRDLLKRVEDLANGGPSQFEHLEACFRFVARRGESLWSCKIGDRALIEHLRQLAWLPTVRDEGERARYGALKDAEDRLYRPDELYPRSMGTLVASQALLCAFADENEFLKALGAREEIPLTMARAHFETVRDAYEAGHASSEVARRTAQRFYVAVGRQLALAPESKRSRFVHGFGRPEVIWDDGISAFRSARHCFAQPVPYFLSLRAHVKGDGGQGAGMDLLGRRDTPGITDLVEYLEDLATNAAGRALSEEEQDSAQRVLMLLLMQLRAELGKPGEEWDGRQNMHVLDHSDRLRRATQVLRADAPWWARRIGYDFVALVHEQLGDELARYVGIKGVSTLREVLVDSPIASGEDAKASMVCRHFAERLSCTPFEFGLRRLIHHEHEECEPELGTVLKLRFEACVSLTTELEGAPLAPEERFGRETVEVYLAEDRVYVAGVSMDDVLPDIAQAVNRRLERYALRDLAPLEEILRVPPSQIESRLNRRRIAPLPETVDPSAHVRWSPDAVGNVMGTDYSRGVENTLGLQSGSDEPLLPKGSDADPSVAGPRHALTDTDELQATSPPLARSQLFVGGSGHAGGSSGPGRSATIVGGYCSEEAGGGPPGGATPSPSVRPRDGRPRLRQRRRRRRFVTYLPAPAGGGTGTSQRSEAFHRLRADAMTEARKHERLSGVLDSCIRENPVEHPGFDLVRQDGDTEAERIIEVIGLSGSWRHSRVALRQATVSVAQALGDRYWVYVVEYAADPERARVHAICNPIVRSTLFELDQGWLVLAERTPDGSRLPAVGRILYRGDHRVGVIERVTGDPASIASTVALGVRTDTGEVRDLTWSRSRHRVEEEDTDG